MCKVLSRVMQCTAFAGRFRLVDFDSLNTVGCLWLFAQFEYSLLAPESVFPSSMNAFWRPFREFVHTTIPLSTSHLLTILSRILSNSYHTGCPRENGLGSSEITQARTSLTLHRPKRQIWRWREV